MTAETPSPRPPVIADFSLEVSSGRTILLGPNGTGKSTLFALGSSALIPQQGVRAPPGVVCWRS
jgi:ABC-type bacteriocin/lantibiotic exporter with double-glycine peptidase domain